MGQRLGPSTGLVWAHGHRDTIHNTVHEHVHGSTACTVSRFGWRSWSTPGWGRRLRLPVCHVWAYRILVTAVRTQYHDLMPDFSFHGICASSFDISDRNDVYVVRVPYYPGYAHTTRYMILIIIHMFMYTTVN